MIEKNDFYKQTQEFDEIINCYESQIYDINSKILSVTKKKSVFLDAIKDAVELEDDTLTKDDLIEQLVTLPENHTNIQVLENSGIIGIKINKDLQRLKKYIYRNKSDEELLDIGFTEEQIKRLKDSFYPEYEIPMIYVEVNPNTNEAIIVKTCILSMEEEEKVNIIYTDLEKDIICQKAREVLYSLIEE